MVQLYKQNQLGILQIFGKIHKQEEDIQGHIPRSFPWISPFGQCGKTGFMRGKLL